jgi:chlorobactene glucosyltransferase
VASALFCGACLVLFSINAATMVRLPSTPGSGSRRPRISVVIPARDEERDIEAAVRSHLAQDYPDFEVLVVDDRSTDATPAILARLCAADRRLHVIAGIEPPEGWLGKPHAVFQGTSRATGELLLLADADVHYGPAAMATAVDLLESKKLDLLAFFPRLEMRGFWENVLMPNLAASYFFGPAFLFNSDRQRRFAAGGGAGMLIRASAYQAAGGHAALRGSVIDDLHLATRVRRAGGRCRMVRSDEHVSLRMYRGFREIYDGFTKNLAWVFEGWMGAALAFGAAFSFLAWTLPAAVLLAWAFGAPAARADLLWAALGVTLAVAARGGVSLVLGYPVWPALTQPFMAVVWSAITVRSFAWRFLRREVLWRGRRFPAARAGF